MQRIRRPEPKPGPQLGTFQIHRLGNCEGYELLEQQQIRLPQNRIAAFARPDQTFEFNKSRNAEIGVLCFHYGTPYYISPPRMPLTEIDQQTSVEVNQPQA